MTTPASSPCWIARRYSNCPGGIGDGDASHQVLTVRHRLGRDEMARRVEGRHDAARRVGGREPEPDGIQIAAGHRHRLESLARDRVGHLHLAARRVPSNREHVAAHVELPREAELVAVRPGAQRDARLPDAPLFGLVLSLPTLPGRLQVLIDRRELLARQHQLLGHGIVAGLVAAKRDGLAEAEDVEQALDQLEVLHVLTRDEVEQEVAFGPGIAPRLVGLEAGGRVGGAAAGLAVADVDDAAVVEVPAARPVALDDVVVPIERGELEILPGVEQAPVVLAEPLAVAREARPGRGRPRTA